MKIPLTTLLLVAEELAKQAKSKMPKMQKGEEVKHEWLKKGVYHRETTFKGIVYQAEYDFKTKKARQFKVMNSESESDFTQIQLSGQTA